jgi:hypothetical protein
MTWRGVCEASGVVFPGDEAGVIYSAGIVSMGSAVNRCLSRWNSLVVITRTNVKQTSSFRTPAMVVSAICILHFSVNKAAAVLLCFCHENSLYAVAEQKSLYTYQFQVNTSATYYNCSWQCIFHKCAVTLTASFST